VPVVEVLLTALGYAIGSLIANRKLADLPPVAVNAVCLGAAAVVYAPFAALTWPRSVPSVQVLLALAGLGVTCTAAAFLVFFRPAPCWPPARVRPGRRVPMRAVIPSPFGLI
jgi:drug/metabolite transporter (DMT)-like permease